MVCTYDEMEIALGIDQLSDLIVDNENSCCGDQVEFGEQCELHEWDDKVAGDLIFLDDNDDDNTSFSNKPFEIKTAFDDDDDESLTEFLDRTEYDYEELERYANEIEQEEKASHEPTTMHSLAFLHLFSF